MLRAIAAAKKKNDRIDASKICDCLRCDFLPECYMASTEIRERRRTLRYRNLLVRQMVLMEAGVSYNKQRLRKAGYFRELLATNPDINEGLKPLLQLCRETVVRLQKTESAMVRSLERDSLLMDRVERLMTIPAVGPITALTWALEVGDVQRFSSITLSLCFAGGGVYSAGRLMFDKDANLWSGHMIRPDGTQSAPMGYTGNGAIDIPWGLNIDGNDDVWVGNFKGLKRDKVNLDIFWLKDESLEESANLPDPDVIAAEIAEDLQAALDQFTLIASDIKKR